MKLVCLILASLAVLATSARTMHEEPTNSTDCSTIIYDMMDCVSFLSDGSKDQKPSSSCCTGLKSVLSADPKCLCVAIKSSGDMGIELNLTRAAVLPKDCGVSAPPLSKCDLPNPPSPAPGKAPSDSPVEPPSGCPDTPPLGPSPPQPSADSPSSKSGVSRSASAISVFLISSLLLLTFDAGLSFLA